MSYSRISGRHHDSVLILDLEGRPFFSGGEIWRVVSNFCLQGERRFLLNMGGVSFLDSVGLGDIVRVRTHVVRQDGRFGLFGVNDRIKELLRVTKMSDVFVVFDTEDAGVRSFEAADEP